MPKGGNFMNQGYKKGQTGNPNGRPRVPEEVVAARKWDKKQVEQTLEKFLDWPLKDLAEHLNDKAIPVIEALIGKILIEGIKKGDHTRMDFLLNRLIGKVKDDVNITGNLSFHGQLVDFMARIKDSRGEPSHEKNSEKEHKED